MSVPLFRGAASGLLAACCISPGASTVLHAKETAIEFGKLAWT
jgi:hypothetical protein